MLIISLSLGQVNVAAAVIIGTIFVFVTIITEDAEQLLFNFTLLNVATDSTRAIIIVVEAVTIATIRINQNGCDEFVNVHLIIDSFRLVTNVKLVPTITSLLINDYEHGNVGADDHL